MKCRDIVDNRFFFAVPKNIQNEIESRKTKATGQISPIGLGVVSATITKKPAGGIVGLLDICLDQIGKKKEIDDNDDDDQWIRDFLGYESPRKKTSRMAKSFDERERLVVSTTKEIVKAKIKEPTPEKRTTVNPLLMEYFSQTRLDFDHGLIGLLPNEWKKQFPVTLEQFTKTPQFEIIEHFLKFLKIKKKLA